MRDLLLPVLAVATIVALSVGAVLLNRPIAKYQEETSRQVEQQSIRRIEGNQANISHLCTQIKMSKDDDFKKAIAQQLVEESGRIPTSDLTADNTVCVNMANEVISQ